MRKLLLGTVAALALALPQGVASACCGGVGADGYTRTWWRGTDGSVSFWKLDSAFNTVGSHNYGPYAGWSPVSLLVLGNNTYMLWNYTDGTATIWKLDANLNFITSQTFGPVAGWEPEGLGSDGLGDIRLVWHTPAHQIEVWVINTALNVVGGSPVYGPYFGWIY